METSRSVTSDYYLQEEEENRSKRPRRDDKIELNNLVKQFLSKEAKMDFKDSMEYNQLGEEPTTPGLRNFKNFRPGNQPLEKKMSLKEKIHAMLPFYRVNEKARIRWDLLIMILAIYNCFALPYEAAFVPEYSEHLAYTLINLAIDFFFFLDILISFRTTIINDRTGIEIVNPREIAKVYLRGRFFIDFISTIPIDSLFSALMASSNDQFINRIKLIKLLKLVRIFRLQKIIQNMNSTENVKLSMSLLKMFFMLILYLHCLGCLWFYAAARYNDMETYWLPPTFIAFQDDGFWTLGLYE